MVQVQVACYKNNASEDVTSQRQLESRNRDDCDIISELLFHNDGASETPNHGLHRIEDPSPIPTSKETSETTKSGEREMIKSNIVMFEFRDQISNLTEEDIGPFASFFENEFLEQVSFFKFSYTSIVFLDAVKKVTIRSILKY